MSLKNIRIILVHPTHPGNIGATARAMKTMCLDKLYLVSCVDYLGPQARARAAGADDVLTNAVACSSLEQALAECQLVVGTSARTRAIPWPALEPRAAAEHLVTAAHHGPVALVFGREKMGLTNAELDLCQHVVTIPANPEYASLNLACAVQVMDYEILRASGGNVESGTVEWHEGDVPYASSDDIDRLYRHLETVLVQIGFLDPANPRKLMRRLYRLFNRAHLDQNEVNILRGVLTAVQRCCGTDTH